MGAVSILPLLLLSAHADKWKTTCEQAPGAPFMAATVQRHMAATEPLSLPPMCTSQRHSNHRCLLYTRDCAFYMSWLVFDVISSFFHLSILSKERKNSRCWINDDAVQCLWSPPHVTMSHPNMEYGLGTPIQRFYTLSLHRQVQWFLCPMNVLL